jgi:tetratricopeptide (TPR) repeat protein
VVAAVLLCFRLPTPTRGDRAQSQAPITFLGIQALSPSDAVDEMSSALAQVLAKDRAVSFGPDAVIAAARRELHSSEGELSSGVLRQIRDQFGVHQVVFGFAVGAAETRHAVWVTCRIQDTTNGETRSIHEYGSVDDTSDLVARIAIRVRAMLSDARTLSQQDALPLEVGTLYEEGEGRLRVWDGIGARRLLQQAIALAPNHGPLHSAISVAWRRLGWDDKARESAKEGLKLAVTLSVPERLLAEGRYADAYRDWRAARDAYARLFTPSSPNFEYGLSLAEAQWHLGDSEATRATLHMLAADASNGRDPRLLILRAVSAQGSLDEMRALAREARVSAEQNKLRFVAAEAGVLEAYSLHASKLRATGFDAAVKYAERIYADAGDEVNFLAVGLRAGNSRIPDKANQVFARVGSDRGQLLIQYRLAETHHRASRLSLARQALDQADETLERIGGVAGELLPIPPRGLSPTSLRAWLEYDSGNVDVARALLDRNRGTLGFDGVPLTDVFPYVLILCEQGEVGNARRLAESGILRARAAADQLHLSRAVHALGRVAHLEGRLGDALRLYQEHVKLAATVGIRTRPWEIVVALTDKGALAEAEAQAELVQEMYRNAKNADRELGGVSARLRVLLARNRLPEAQRAGERARMLATGTESSRVRLRVRIDLALLDAALGGRAQASNQLREIIAEAHRKGLLQTELEARLAICGVGRAPADDVARLRHEAQAKGFGLIARDAARLGSTQTSKM